MKCPKCGYNSFEFHDSCTKCSNDLTGFKNTYGLKSIVFPLEARTVMAESLLAETADHEPDILDAPNDMFSFDIPDEDAASAASTSPKDDPFSFDDEPAVASGAGEEFSFGDDQPDVQVGADTNAFADLLESTSQNVADPFSAATEAPAPAAGSPGEFDMNSFSWDEPAPAAGDVAGKPVEDDFNSLFGDKDDAFK